MHPFVAAKYTYLMTESGPARILPVELTMANDLPVMLSSSPLRGHIPYGEDPFMLLYFLRFGIKTCRHLASPLSRSPRVSLSSFPSWDNRTETTGFLE